jgi:hypothetical protein
LRGQRTWQAALVRLLSMPAQLALPPSLFNWGKPTAQELHGGAGEPAQQQHQK